MPYSMHFSILRLQINDPFTFQSLPIIEPIALFTATTIVKFPCQSAYHRVAPHTAQPLPESWGWSNAQAMLSLQYSQCKHLRYSSSVLEDLFGDSSSFTYLGSVKAARIDLDGKVRLPGDMKAAVDGGLRCKYVHYFFQLPLRNLQ